MSTYSASGPVRAWVDESGSNPGRDPGTYVLAAAVARVAVEDDTRVTISKLRLPRQAKLHWRDENGPRRRRITQALAGCSIEHLVVVRGGRTEDRAERRRRKCFERLMFELAQGGVEQVVLESRGPADDRRDIQMLNAMRGQGYVASSVRLHHVVGHDEPLLWIPDAVCGAVTSARTGNPAYLELLAAQITIVEI